MILKNILNKIKNLEQKNAIQVYLSTQTNVTTDTGQRAKIPLDTILTQFGTNFGFEDGFIIANKSMHLRIRGRITFNVAKAGNYGLTIQKNSDTNTHESLEYKNINSYQNLTGEVLLNVDAGDKIGLLIRTVALTNQSIEINSGRLGTCLIIEEI